MNIKINVVQHQIDLQVMQIEATVYRTTQIDIFQRFARLVVLESVRCAASTCSVRVKVIVWNTNTWPICLQKIIWLFWLDCKDTCRLLILEIKRFQHFEQCLLTHCSQLFLKCSYICRPACGRMFKFYTLSKTLIFLHVPFPNTKTIVLTTFNWR